MSAKEKEDWFTNLLKEMIKNKYTMTNLGKFAILREKDGMTTFNFRVEIKKSLFMDILSDEEKSFTWLEEQE